MIRLGIVTYLTRDPPRQVLVIAGNYRQFELWRRTQAGDRARRSVYLATPERARGYGPENVESVVLTGEWWLSELYRDELSWGPLVRLKEAVEDGRLSWYRWNEQTLEERALMRPHEEQGQAAGAYRSGGGRIQGETRFRVEGERSGNSRFLSYGPGPSRPGRTGRRG